jgi:hypothetical protein
LLAESNEGHHPPEEPSDAPDDPPESEPAQPEPPTAPAIHDRFTVRTYILPEPVVHFADRVPRSADERAKSHRRQSRRRWRRRIQRWFTGQQRGTSRDPIQAGGLAKP